MVAESSSAGTIFDASSKRSWIDGSMESTEQKSSAEEAPRELSASPEQLTSIPSIASQPSSPDDGATHAACATGAAVTVSVAADCKKRYTSAQLRSYSSVPPPSSRMAASLRSSGVSCHSFAGACSVQLPREASDLPWGRSASSGTKRPPASSPQQSVRPAQYNQLKRKVWKWVAWIASQTSTQPAGRNPAHALSQQKA